MADYFSSLPDSLNDRLVTTPAFLEPHVGHYHLAQLAGLALNKLWAFGPIVSV